MYVYVRQRAGGSVCLNCESVCVCVSWTSVPECVCVSEAMCVCAAGSAGLDVSLCEVTLVSDQIPRHFLCRRNNRALTSENLPHSLSLAFPLFQLASSQPHLLLSSTSLA